MTICIAALCESGETVVASADRMVTVPGLNLEVERMRSKISPVSENQIVMSSGDGLLASEILHELEKTYVAAGDGDVDAAAERFLEAYIALRQRRIAEQFTRPIGYDLARFHADGMKNLGPQLFMTTLQMMGQFSLGADFLYVGFAGQKARVALVSHPGTMRWFDSQEFFAIGSGQMHAISGMLLSGHAVNCSREQAVFSVYESKRLAERAPGVGNSTDMQIVRRDGIKKLGEDTFMVLESMYKALTERSRSPVGDFAQLKESIDAAQA